MSDVAHTEEQTTGEEATGEERAKAGAGEEWWDVDARPSEVVDRLLHPQSATMSDLDWWAATGSDVLDRFLHLLPGESL